MSQSIVGKMILSSLALGLFASTAAAQQPPPSYPAPPPGYPAPPPSYPAPPPGYPPPGYQPAQPYYPYSGQVAVQPRPGVHQHDGFYLRMQLGPGYTSMTGEAGSTDIEVKGAGAGFSIAVGGAVAENFILFGHLIADTAMEPEVKITGVGSGTAKGSASLTGFGLGAAFYVMPANLYLSGSLLGAQISISDEDGDKVGETKVGFGMDLSIGKEWWVSDNWGVGVAGQFMAARMKDKEAIPGGTVPEWTAWGFSIAFSATFN